jgi:hypothetical protein
MIHGSERSDPAWLCEHGVPGVLASLEDILIGGKQAVAEEVVFKVLPGFFGRVAFGSIGRNREQGNIGGKAQRLGAVPAGAIGNDGGMDLGGELSADCIEMQLHHGGVGAGQNQTHGAATLGAKGAEDIGIVIARIDRHRRARAFGSPAVGAATFLADAGFILTPQLNGLAGMGGGDGLECGREFF